MAIVSAGGATSTYQIPTFFTDVFVKAQWSGPWLLADYLAPEQSETVGIHGNSRATFRFRFGDIKHEDRAAFLVELLREYRGLFIAIRVTPSPPQRPFTSFVGYVPAERLQLHGTSADDVASGWQTFQAAGLEYLLSRRVLLQVPFMAAGQNPEEESEYSLLDVQPGFNERDQVGLRVFGNRSDIKLNITGPPAVAPTYAFCTDAFVDGQAYAWSRRDIVELLLTWTDTDENRTKNLEPGFVLGGDPALLDYLDALVDEIKVGRRDCLSALRQLIDRRRGLSAHLNVSYDNEYLPDNGAVELEIVSMSPADITVGPYTLPAHPIQNLLPFSLIPGTEEVAVRISDLTVYDRFVVRGRPLLVCFSAASLLVAPGQEESAAEQFNIARFSKGWADADETAHEAAIDPDRLRDRFGYVYKRFLLGTGWGEFDWQTTGRPEGLNVHYLNPALNDKGQIITPIATNGPFANMATEALNSLPIAARADVAAETLERRFSKPFIVWELLDSDGKGTGYWVAADDPPDSGQRYAGDDASVMSADITAGLLVPQRGMEFRVNTKPMAHAIAKGTFVPGSEAPSKHNPVYDWRRMLVTLAYRTEQRPTVTLERSSAGDVYTRTLPLEEPTAELWYVAPGTIQAIGPNGQLEAHPGGVVRDDSARLQLLAALAYTWYGGTRATIEVRFKRMFWFPLGWFIKAVLSAAGYQDVGTPISRVAHDYVRRTTTIATGQIELDTIGKP